MPSPLTRVLLIAALAAAALSVLSMTDPTAGAASPAPARVNLFKSQCRDAFSADAKRDPTNPLMLPTAPGDDPLTGANFFVNGPAHGDAAGAIARLLGYDLRVPIGSVLKNFKETESWATFSARTDIKAKLLPAATARNIALLSKIAAEPEVQRVSSYSEGGGAGAIFSQTDKLFCHNFLADPGSVPIISTYFLHASLGGCANRQEINAYLPTFHRRVDELVKAIADHPVVLLLETDGIGSSSCYARHGLLSNWEDALRYEVNQAATLPHAVVYIEGGYSDSNSPGYTARALKAVNIQRIRGFFTNDTHNNWTINEINWAEQVVRDVGGTHFIVNTAQNGNGPLIPRNRGRFGNEILCNPPGRGLGPLPTTATGYPNADAFMWTSPPGNSSGTCNGGTAAGTFWATRAIELSAHANARLGPRFPSDPY